jgi:YD repeat-containing protein
MKTSSTVILVACATVGLLALVSSTSAQAANAGSQSKGVHAQPCTAALLQAALLRRQRHLPSSHALMKIFQPILALLLPLKAMACGLDWSPPVSHFENVDYQGNVHIVRKIGEVEKLPLYLIFNSTFGNSPYVGSGFELPFLEARMWQVDEGRFQAKMPTGWLWIFQRTKDPAVLEGNAGWKGVIKDDTITAWAPCGDKITFKTGRIASMKIKEDLYNYNYRNGRVASVEKNGRSVLEIKRDAMTGEVTGLALPGTWETIGLAATAERPVVESIGGKNVVSRVEKTLGEVTPASGSDGKVTFEQTVNGELNPTIKLGDQLIAWNPSTKKIAKDGEWTYDIKPGAGPFDNAAIGRENARNQSEFWHHDVTQGKENIVDSHGQNSTRKWFTSGKLLNKERSLNLTSAAGQQLYSFKASYDENGRLVNYIEDRDVYVLTYDQQGQLGKVAKNDSTVWMRTVDALGRLLHEIVYPGYYKHFTYNNDGSVVLDLITPKLNLKAFGFEGRVSRLTVEQNTQSTSSEEF